MTRFSRVRGVLGAVLGVVLVLTACTEIPRESEVQSVIPGEVVDEADVDFLPPGPSAGQTPEEILQGFIAAGTAAQNNYRVARSYLAESISEEWNPNQGVLIRAGEARIEPLEDNRLLYSVPVLASVDDAGRYTASQSVGVQELEFGLVEENGEWRIAEAPAGIVLTEFAFREAFASYRVYYYSADYRELVPDSRWFAVRGDVLTKIVRAMVEPPTFWLAQGATVSAFPPGVQLALSPVPIVDGEAQVDLTEQVLDADDVGRQRLLQQLVVTLQQVSGVSGVTVTVDQVPLAIKPLGDVGPTIASGRDPRTLVLRGSEFGWLQAGRIERIEGVSSVLVELEPRLVVYSPQLQQAAAVNDEGMWLIDSDDAEARLLDERESLIRPTIDSCGFIWSHTASVSDDGLRIYRPGGDFSTLTLELPAESTVVSLEIARDNTRLALLVQSAAGVRVLLVAVERDEGCAPVRFGEFLELGPLPGRGVDAAWVDDGHLAVVVRQDTLGEVFLLDVNGRSETLGRPSAPVALVGGVGGVVGLRLINDQGVLFQPRGNGWQATGDRADVLATQR